VEALFAAVDIGGVGSNAVSLLVTAITIVVAFLAYKIAKRAIGEAGSTDEGHGSWPYKGAREGYMNRSYRKHMR
jgi:hypothetical protein